MKRLAVVTGAARGIGAATVALLREQGWDVVGFDRDPPPPGSIDAWRVVDLVDPAAIQSALADLDRIDGLVNNAAIQHSTPLVDTTPEQWDSVLAVNLRAPFLTTRACAERLAASEGGSIVNVASVHGLATSANVAPYAASKGGLLAFTRAAAIELAGRGIRVNAVVPGAIDTDALRDGFARQVTGDPQRVLKERTPLGRFGQASEIAETISFLLDSKRSSFTTGQALTVDGGVVARLASE